MEARAELRALLARHVARWGLVADGEIIVPPTSLLLPARQAGRSVMLKVTEDDDERHGHLLMCWWNGDGAAQVHACDDALLMERAQAPRSLLAMASSDDAARCASSVRSRPAPPPLA